MTTPPNREIEEAVRLAADEVADDAACRSHNGTPWYDDARLGRVLFRAPRLARTVLQLAARVEAYEAQRTVEVDSSDVEALTMAQAILVHVRESSLTVDSADREYEARIAHAESVLARIAKDSMMKSPIARAYLAAALTPTTTEET